jgi:hypothetical protein
MPFLTEVEIDNKVLRVLQFDFELSKAIDVTGKAISFPQGGIIHLLIDGDVTDRDLLNLLFDWLKNPTLTKKGKITVHSDENKQQQLEVIEFSTALCVGYRQVFNYEGKIPLMINLKVSAMELTLLTNDKSTFKNNWPACVA